MKHLKLFEQYSKIPKEFDLLKSIALRFDSSSGFSNSLNHNEIGHDRKNSFLGERFLRLKRGYELDEVSDFEGYDMNDEVTIYRTGDSPIKWGDYVYINYEDASHGLYAGQGNKIYNKNVTYGDLIYATQGSGEFFYSPKHLREWSRGDNLEDFWKEVNDIIIPSTKTSDSNYLDRVKKYKEELSKLGNKHLDFHKYEQEALELASKMNVPIDGYEEYFYE